MIRLKVRLESPNALAKILRVTEEITLPLLLEKIAHRLGVPRSSHRKEEKSHWRLLLGGDVLIEDPQEIDDGDDLVLMLNNNTQPAVKVKPEVDKETTKKSSSLLQDKHTHVDRRVAKVFDKKLYFGTIDRFVDKEDNNYSCWHVQYDDGDDEEFYESDLCKVLELYRKEKESDTHMNACLEAKLDAQEDADFVEDVTEQVLKEKKRRLEDQAIELESDSESDKDHKDDEEYLSSDDDDESDFQEDASVFDDSDNLSEDLEQVQTIQESKKKKKASANKNKEPPLKVLMEEKDVPSAPGKRCAHDKDQETSETMDASSLLVDNKRSTNNEADRAVKERIFKLLNTGFHDKSNENEAKNAMRLAQRLMRKHNLSQALLLQERENKANATTNEDGEILKGGMVKVQIVNRKTKRAAQFARWIADLVHPICRNFEVESFHCVRRGWRCDVTFYGIYTNAQLAAYAFRVAAERISQMAAEYIPEKSIYRSVPTKSARLSYALGTVKGLLDEVNATMRREKEERRKKLENARRADSSGEAYDESDDEDQTPWGSNDDNDNDDDCDSPDGGGHSHLDKPKGDDKGSSDKRDNMSSNLNGAREESQETASAIPVKESKATSMAKRLEDLEKEERAAIVLVDHREKIAEEVLKEQGIKVRSGRKRKAITFDWKSYQTGIEDSKEIDINQRALRDSARVKKEKR